MRGKHSRVLCGPALGLGAQVPVSLSSIQCFGAFNLFICFFGPRAYGIRLDLVAKDAKAIQYFSACNKR